jgi:TonB family protein
MNSSLVKSRPSSRRRWWGWVAVIFSGQLGLIFWLGDTAPIHPRPAVPAFTLKLAGSASDELLALNDPTLFALPHRPGQIGAASQRTLRPESHSFQWLEPTNSLVLTVGQVGAVFSRFIETNAFNALQLPASLKPTVTLPYLPPLAVSAGQSTLLLEGDLAQQRLVTPPRLTSWTNLDILTSSVVRIAVDSEGRPVSPTLLSSSGSAAADQYAIEQARTARFEPVRRNPIGPTLNPRADLSLVRMIFRWHTVPPPPTNIPAARP